MKNLILFIIRNHYTFLFFLLEIAAFIMIVNSNHFQRAGFINSSNEITGRVYSLYSDITDYFYLKHSNDLLVKENAYLRSIYFESFVKQDIPRFYINDPNYKQKYSYIPAEVVNNSTSKQKNYITLDKGYKHGVRKDMGVIGPEGIVGVVMDVSENFSSVISLLNIDLKVSVKEKKSNYVGSLEWDGVNKNRGIVRDISTYVKLNIGDSILTSGYSSIFPQGILVGTISDFDTIPGENFYTIYVRYINDFNKLTHVYIVNNLFHNEQVELEEKTQKQ